eukprot:Clim_evm12s3 gene=Clim_evmTU12s3
MGKSKRKTAKKSQEQLQPGDFSDYDIQTGLPIVEGYTQDEVRDGFSAFFQNRQQEAEEFFKPHQDIPQMALGYGAISHLRAMMTFEREDMDRAFEVLSHAETVAHRRQTHESILTGFTRWFSGEEKKPMSGPELHLIVMEAEAQTMQAVTYLLLESWYYYIKGGLMINKAWKLYQDIWRRYQEGECHGELDEETISGIEFGIGQFNMTNSLLPPKVRRIIEFIGFTADQELGLKLLNRTMDRNGIRSPIAALGLLVFHVVFQGQFGGRPETSIKEAERILKKQLELFPDGALFLFMRGRLLRIKKDTEPALEDFTKAREAMMNFAQMRHLCDYELGWTFMYRCEYEESERYWNVLERESEWSPSYYVYMRACCKVLQRVQELSTKREKGIAITADADELFKKAESMVGKKKFGGKTMPVEQHIQRALKSQYFAPILRPLVVIYMWGGFEQMDREFVEKLGHYLAWMQATATWGAESQDLADFLAAIILLNEGKIMEAKHGLRQVLDKLASGLGQEVEHEDQALSQWEEAKERESMANVGNVGPEPDVVPMSNTGIDHTKPMGKGKTGSDASLHNPKAYQRDLPWLYPYGCFEMARIYFHEGDVVEGKKYMNQTRRYKTDYEFELRLRLRIHLLSNAYAEQQVRTSTSTTDLPPASVKGSSTVPSTADSL